MSIKLSRYQFRKSEPWLSEQERDRESCATTWSWFSLLTSLEHSRACLSVYVNKNMLWENRGMWRNEKNSKFLIFLLSPLINIFGAPPCSPHFLRHNRHPLPHRSQTPDRKANRNKIKHLFLWLCTAGMSTHLPKDSEAKRWGVGCGRWALHRHRGGSSCWFRPKQWEFQVGADEQGWADVWGCVMVVAEAEAEDEVRKQRASLRRERKVRSPAVFWSDRSRKPERTSSQVLVMMFFVAHCTVRAGTCQRESLC